MNLKNKVFVITGASLELGQSLPHNFQRRGGLVVCAARTKEKLEIVCHEISKNGGHSIAVQADITDKTQCDKIINVAVEKYKRIDGLVLNAGISMWAKFDKLKDVEFFKGYYEYELYGFCLLCSRCPSFFKKSKGKIISCSTGQAIMGFPNHSGYVASKHALHGFLSTIRMENKADITVLEAVLSWIKGTKLRENSFRADGENTMALLENTQAKLSLLAIAFK